VKSTKTTTKAIKTDRDEVEDIRHKRYLKYNLKRNKEYNERMKDKQQ